MKHVFRFLTVILFVIVIGIIGGVETGQPLTNLWYLIPCTIGIMVGIHLS